MVSPPRKMTTSPPQTLETRTHEPILSPTSENGEPTEKIADDSLIVHDSWNANHVISFIPASWLGKAVWISNQSKAIETADAPTPEALEEFLKMDEKEQASYFDALAKSYPPEFVISMRQSPQKWKEEVGLDLFNIKSAVGFGPVGRFPQGTTILVGEFSETAISQRLLDSGYEPRTYEGKEYYVIREDFQTKPGASGQSRLNCGAPSASNRLSSPLVDVYLVCPPSGWFPVSADCGTYFGGWPCSAGRSPYVLDIGPL